MSAATPHGQTPYYFVPEPSHFPVLAATGLFFVILGSGTLVSHLSAASLIDGYQLVIVPVVLGKGRTPFETVTARFPLTLAKTRAFGNGNVVLWYERA